MKSFQKMLLLSLFPVLFVGFCSTVIATSFVDFKTEIVTFIIGFFTLVATNYVYVFERRALKNNNTVKHISITAISTFLSIATFSSVLSLIFFDGPSILTVLFQALFGVIILLLEFGLIVLYRGRKNGLQFNEQPVTYLIIILAVTVTETVFFALFSIELLVKTDFLLFCFNTIFFPTFQITSASMLGLYLVSQINLSKRSIYILTTVLALLASSIVYIVFKGDLQTHRVIARLFVMVLASTFLSAAAIVYRNKQKESKQIIYSLTNSISKKQTEYLQLKNQVNPHFLFNNLNTLISFIEIEPKKAIEFGHHLSNVYRHYLKNENEDFVSLSNELKFIGDYLEIYKAKFESGFTFKVQENVPQNLFVLSISLQEIVDNIFKHNILDDESPLDITIFIEDSYLTISNSLNTQTGALSNKKGLQNINDRNRILLNRDIIIFQNKSCFKIKVPIIALEK